MTDGDGQVGGRLSRIQKRRDDVAGFQARYHRHDLEVMPNPWQFRIHSCNSRASSHSIS